MQCSRAVRLSVFNQYVDDCPEPGSTLVYNTFTGGMVELDRDELAALRAMDAGELPGDDVDAGYLDPSVGIVVESRAAEEAAYRAWYEELRARRRLTLVVSTTFACNLDCTYCCQSDVLDGRTMTPDTADATAAFVAARAHATGAAEAHIDFVGGEPLLHPSRIEAVVAGVRARAPGLRLTFGLITNGVFLTRERVLAWRPLGLTQAQVTLDGDGSTHAMTRRSKRRGEDSFATIFANVVDVCRLIDVKVNGNYQTDTAHGFVPLVTALRDAGFPSGGRVHFSPALAALGAPSDAASRSCTWSGSSPELMIGFADAIRRAGFDPGDTMVVGPCGFHFRETFAVDPEGHVYKCPGFLGHPEWAVGHVTSGLTSAYDRLVAHDIQGACGDCGHRPSCAGGCVAARWLAAGRVEGVSCELDYFERNKDPLIRRKHALAVSDTVEEALALVPPAPRPRSTPVPHLRPTSLRVIAA